jgi:hypothetical protein
MKGTLINDYVVYDYAETMALEPYVHDVMAGVGFTLELVEHPIYGDESPVLAVDHNNKIVFNTGAYDPWNDTDKEYIYDDYMKVLEIRIRQAVETRPIKNTRLDGLLAVAGVLAERINRARFEERVPDTDDTVRLCEILDILIDMED